MPWPLIAAAAISGLSGVLGAREQKKGSKLAAAVAAQQQQQAQQDFAPYQALGAGAAEQLGRFQAGDWSALTQSPEYAFNVAETQKAIERRQGSGALSGAGIKEAARYTSGLASQQVGSFVDRLLASAGLGASSAGQGAALGANAAAQQGQAAMAAGDARASGYGAVGNAAIGGVSDLLLNKYLGGAQGQGGGASGYAYTNQPTGQNIYGGPRLAAGQGVMQRNQYEPWRQQQDWGNILYAGAPRR